MKNQNTRRASGWPPIMAIFNNPVEASVRKRSLEKDSKPDVKGAFVKVTQPNPFGHEFIDRRIIRITGVIDGEMATAIIAQMNMLEGIAPNKDIELRLNSPGGSITAGLAIYDAMKTLHCDVKTVCEGECASMASVLLAAGTPGKRFAMPSSRIMIHGPSGGFEGTEIDMDIYMTEMRCLKDKMIEILSSYMGQEPAKIVSMMQRDTFMSAAEAKALGVVDEVIELRHKPPAPKSKNDDSGGKSDFTIPPSIIMPEQQKPLLH